MYKRIASFLSSLLRSIVSYSKRHYPLFFAFMQRREWIVVVFFFSLIALLFVRLFALQFIQSDDYDSLLTSNHTSSLSFKAQRWQVYATTRANDTLKLTDNITLYTVFVDPQFVKQKDKFITLITPLIYTHLCQNYGFSHPDQEQCIRNIESFTQKDILPKAPERMYYGGDVVSDNYYTFDMTGYMNTYTTLLSGFTTGTAYDMISQRLHDRIVIGERKYNYVGFFSDTALLDRVRALQAPYIHIIQDHYIFIEPRVLAGFSRSRAINDMTDIFAARGYDDIVDNLDSLTVPHSYRYVRLMTNVHPMIADAINKLKIQYYKDYAKTDPDKIPLFHGVGLEPYTRRYYPYANFMSHILGYVDKDGNPLYGVEQYFNDILKGADGKIEWRSASWAIGANDFTIKNVENGYDVYLTIDPSIQKQVEIVAQKYQKMFQSDSVSVLVYDPYSGHVIASANAPDFDPNNVSEVYALTPLAVEYGFLADDLSRLDYPLYVQTGGETRVATVAERSDTTLPKYMTKVPLWPNLFIDKNIAFPYEPWSIFKAFTYAIGLDTNEIDMYDEYTDLESQVKIGDYTIRNAAVEACQWVHSFLYALQHSCNVGMVRIAQKLTKNLFYNYLDKLWFGQMTHIELAGEDPWFVDNPSTVSLTRFYNNVFGQWLLATPIQIAAAYGAVLNGGQYIKPTILDKICEWWTTHCQYNKTKIVRQVFDPRISELLKFSLVQVLAVKENAAYADIPWYKEWGKSWTSQIAFRGKYKDGRWWTNGSFVGMITQDNLTYLVTIQVRRPRTSQRWNQTAWAIFKEIATFLINYETIQGGVFLKDDKRPALPVSTSSYGEMESFD